MYKYIRKYVFISARVLFLDNAKILDKYLRSSIKDLKKFSLDML